MIDEEAQKLYDIHRQHTFLLTELRLPEWRWLNSQEKAKWEQAAFEQAERDRKD